MDRRYRYPSAPRPGRVSTYFNSPYARNIADNLSLAIYGDPRDDLVREQIANAQAARQRQAEQDELAEQQRLEKAGYRDAFVGSMMEASGLEDEAARQAMQAQAAGDYFRATGDLPETMMPLFLNQRYQGQVNLQDDRQGHEVGMQDDRQEHAIEELTLGNTFKRGQMALGHVFESDILGQNHTYDMADLAAQYKYGQGERGEQFLYSRAEDLINNSSQVLNTMVSDGLWSEALAEQAGMPTSPDVVTPLPGGQADPTSPTYLPPGGARKTGTLLDISPSDAERMSADIRRRVDDQFGPGAWDAMPTQEKDLVYEYLSGLYQQSRDWPRSLAQVRNIIGKHGSETFDEDGLTWTTPDQPRPTYTGQINNANSTTNNNGGWSARVKQ